MLLLLLGCSPRTSTTCALEPCGAVAEDSDDPVAESATGDSEEDSAVPEHVAQLVGKQRYFDTIQEAIVEASDGDVVLVQPGTHYENIDFHGKGIHVLSASGADATVLDGQGQGSVVEIRALEPATAILEGFTITNGQGTEDHGGGIFVENADPLIVHNVVRNNQANIGGGIYLRHGAAEVRNNLIVDNIADEGGGGLTCTNCKGRIAYNTFAGNEARLGPFAEIFYEPQGDFIANLAVVPEDSDMAIRWLEPRGTTFEFSYNMVSPAEIPWVEAENPWLDEFPDDGTNPGGDPSFGDHYVLLEGSAGVDQGPPGDTDADGSPADLGAYGGPDGDWSPAEAPQRR